MTVSPPAMAFDQFAKSPFVCDIGSRKNLHIPRMTRKDWRGWAAERDKSRREETLAQFGDNEEAKAKFLAFYVIPPTSPREMRNLVETFDGQEEIIRRCLRRIDPPMPTDEEIDEFLEYNSQVDIELMAKELACVLRPPKSGTTNTAAVGASASESQKTDDLGNEPEENPL